MILIDSSAWIEFFSKGRNYKDIYEYLKQEDEIIVPAIVIFEVYRKICRSSSSEEALSAVASLSSFEVVNVTKEIALTAADLSITYHLGMADSLILATAQDYNSLLVTLDHDFIKIPGVKVLK